MSFFPFNLDGPAFLWFYGLLCASAWVVGATMALRQRGTRKPVGRIEDLDPYALAWFAGGSGAVFARALTSLAQRGWVDERGAVDPARAQDAGDLHPIEAEVLRQLPAGLEAASAAFRGAPHDLRRELERRGYLLSAEQVGRLRLRLGFVLGAVLALGLVRCIQGLATGHPVGFLILMMILFAVLSAEQLAQAGRRRRSPHGERQLAHLRRSRKDLRVRAKSMDSADLPMDVALLGSVALADTQLGYLERDLRRSRAPHSQSAGGCGANADGSGCDTGGGGGSSGCGGCGGGGD